jgi:flagellar motor switch/type III secretory pathway protein FliN
MNALNLTELQGPEVVLPQVEKALVDQWDALSKRAIEGKVRLGGLDWSYTQRDTTSPGQTIGTVVGFTVNGQKMSICLNTELTTWFEELDSFSEEFDALSPDRLALVIEHIFDDGMIQLETERDTKIEITQVVQNVEFDTFNQLGAWKVLGEVPAATFTAYFDAEDREAALEKLVSAFPEREPRSLRHLKVPCVFLGPISILGAHDIQQLREGSVYFPDQDWSYGGQLALCLKTGNTLLGLSQQDGKLVANGHEDDLSALAERHAHGGTRMTQGTEARGQTTALVTVELASEELSIADIEEIRAGSVVDFEIGRVDLVTLSVAGNAIAEGRLVQLENTIGVQITRLL